MGTVRLRQCMTVYLLPHKIWCENTNVQNDIFVALQQISSRQSEAAFYDWSAASHCKAACQSQQQWATLWRVHNLSLQPSNEWMMTEGL
jgi:hypothetical protein